MKEKCITITKPVHGWSTLTIPCKTSECEISLSYIDDIADYFLSSIINYLTEVENIEDTIILNIDEEGNTMKIISDQYRTYIINEGEEILYVSDFDVLQLIRECTKEFKAHINEWAEFSIFEEFKNEYDLIVKKNKETIKSRIQIIERLLDTKI